MITIRNTQTHPLDEKTLLQDAHTICAHLGISDFDLGILLCDSAAMQDYNKTYRGKDKPTDILSFPFYPDLKAGELPTPQSDEEKNIGDIIICPEYVHGDLERWGQSFETRMKVLLVHGICHLLGYDHIEDDDYTIMSQKEREILAFLNE